MVAEEGWRLEAVPGGLEVRGLEELASAPSPVAAEEWACSPGNTGPGSDGRCLQHKRGLLLGQRRVEHIAVSVESHLPAAPPGHPGQTAPTSGATTAWPSTPGCQTYRGVRPGT